MSYYLFDHPNPYAPIRGNGIRFWGYPARTSPVRLIVVHTPEVLPDWTGPDTSAESVAAYFATTSRSVSAHACIDRDSTVECLPDEAVGFHVAGYNSVSVGVEIGYAHDVWGVDVSADEAILRRAASWMAVRALRWTVPPTRISRAQADAGGSGFVAHADLDPGRRRDPGPLFDWDMLLGLVEEEMDRMGAKQWTRATWQVLVDTGIVAPAGSATVDYWADPARTDTELAHAENVVVQGLAARSVPAAHSHPVPTHSHKVSGSAL